MIKKLAALFFVCALICGGVDLRVFAQSRSAEEVKAKITKYGISSRRRVTVKLKDRNSLKGHISEIKEDRFVIKDPKTGNSTPVAYSDVEKVKTGFDWGGAAGIAALIGGGGLLITLLTHGS